LTKLVERAFSLALDLHGKQSRKASIVPSAAYMSHLLEVAGMVWGCFAVDDPEAEIIAAAALLHDAIEDQPESYPWNRIVAECGTEVLNLVESLTETGTGNPDSKEKAPWQERKFAYLDHISEMSTPALLISVCDKLQSARELKRQVRRVGNSAYVPFKDVGELAKECRERQLWFHENLVLSYRTRLAVISRDLKGPIIAAIDALIEEFADVVEWLEEH
jgi:(p)ppGpp synthase/HD superfamily hydrolase